MMAAQRSVSLPHSEAPEGIVSWHILDWDSEQLGMPAARIDLLDAVGSYSEARIAKRHLLASLLKECREAGIRYLSARVASEDLNTIHVLEEAGFEMLDGIVTFRRHLNEIHGSAPRGTRLFELADLPAVLEIARTAFTFDRFHADPALSAAIADQVHENWTRACCLGVAADAVLVAEEEHRIASYATCTSDHKSARGTIGLVATAEWARRRGAARRGNAAVLCWLQAQGMETAEVGTQFRNIPAARLYESLGFRLTRTSITFRKLL